MTKVNTALHWLFKETIHHIRKINTGKPARYPQIIVGLVKLSQLNKLVHSLLPLLLPIPAYL